MPPIILIAIAAVAAIILIIFLASLYKKAPPTEAMVITGVGHREPKVICGKGAIVLPVLQRVDRLLMRIMKVDVKTPQTGVKTNEGVPLWLDAVVTIQVYCNSSTITQKELEAAGCKHREEYIKMRQQAAISNFLGYNEEQISAKVNDILQGNLREIVATMNVMDVLTKRKEFAEAVIENARPDLAKMGLEVVTFNIQDIQDAVDGCGGKHGVVEAIGVQREMEVKRDAEQAKATALRDIEIAKANAARETAERKAEAEKLTAQANTDLALKKAALPVRFVSRSRKRFVSRPRPTFRLPLRRRKSFVLRKRQKSSRDSSMRKSARKPMLISTRPKRAQKPPSIRQRDAQRHRRYSVSWKPRLN